MILQKIRNLIRINGIDLIAYIHVASALWLVASMLFLFRYQYWPIVAYFGTFALDYIVSRRWQTFRWTQSKWLYVAFILFYCFIHIWQISDPLPPTRHYNGIVENRLPFLAFGLIGILGLSDKYRLRYFGYILILTSVVTCLWLIVSKIGFSNFVLSANKTELFTFVRIAHVNSHMIFNLYLNTALIFAFYILRKMHKQKVLKVLMWLSTLFICYVLFLSEGRTGFISAALVMLVVAAYTVWNWRKRYFPFVVFGVIVLLMLVIPYKSRITQINHLEDPRFNLWRVCYGMIDEKPLTGYGVSSARSHFVEEIINDSACYNQYVKAQIIDNPAISSIDQMHPHNAFIESQLEFGILGLALFIFILVFPILTFPSKRRIYVLLYISCFAIQAMFETLGTQLMPIAFCFFVTLWHQGNSDSNKKEIEETE